MRSPAPPAVLYFPDPALNRIMLHSCYISCSIDIPLIFYSYSASHVVCLRQEFRMASDLPRVGNADSTDGTRQLRSLKAGRPAADIADRSVDGGPVLLGRRGQEIDPAEAVSRSIDRIHPVEKCLELAGYGIVVDGSGECEHVGAAYLYFSDCSIIVFAKIP